MITPIQLNWISLVFHGTTMSGHPSVCFFAAGGRNLVVDSHVFVLQNLDL